VSAAHPVFASAEPGDQIIYRPGKLDAGEGFEPLGRAYETTRSPESPRYTYIINDLGSLIQVNIFYGRLASFSLIALKRAGSLVL